MRSRLTGAAADLRRAIVRSAALGFASSPARVDLSVSSSYRPNVREVLRLPLEEAFGGRPAVAYSSPDLDPSILQDLR